MEIDLLLNEDKAALLFSPLTMLSREREDVTETERGWFAKAGRKGG